MRLHAASWRGRATVRGVLAVALISFALAGVIAVVALADHHHKNAQSVGAIEASWYCGFRARVATSFRRKTCSVGGTTASSATGQLLLPLVRWDRRGYRRLRARAGGLALGPQHRTGLERRFGAEPGAGPSNAYAQPQYGRQATAFGVVNPLPTVEAEIATEPSLHDRPSFLAMTRVGLWTGLAGTSGIPGSTGVGGVLLFLARHPTPPPRLLSTPRADLVRHSRLDAGRPLMTTHPARQRSHRGSCP